MSRGAGSSSRTGGGGGGGGGSGNDGAVGFAGFAILAGLTTLGAGVLAAGFALRDLPFVFATGAP